MFCVQRWVLDDSELITKGGDYIPAYPGCLGSNWREMASFWAWREVKGVHLYFLEGFHLYGCILSEFIIIWVCFDRAYTHMSL